MSQEIPLKNKCTVGLNTCGNLGLNKVSWKTLSTIIHCIDSYNFVPTFDSSFGKHLLSSSRLQLNEVFLTALPDTCQSHLLLLS